MFYDKTTRMLTFYLRINCKVGFEAWCVLRRVSWRQRARARGKPSLLWLRLQLSHRLVSALRLLPSTVWRPSARQARLGRCLASRGMSRVPTSQVWEPVVPSLEPYSLVPGLEPYSLDVSCSNGCDKARIDEGQDHCGANARSVGPPNPVTAHPNGHLHRAWPAHATTSHAAG